MKVSGILFNFDGTLIQSSINFKEMKSEIISLLGSLGATVNGLTPEKATVEIVDEGIKRLRLKGRNDEFMFKVEKIMDSFELKGVNNAKVIPGIQESLRKLKERNYKLAIITRSCKEYTKKVLERTGLSNFIDLSLSRDEVENPKPSAEHLLKALENLNLKPEEALMVGDHKLDYISAKKAGVKFIGVLTGFSSEKELREAGVELIIESVASLPYLIDKIDC